MDFIADLHIHSPYSRATSRDCDPAGLAAWARVKGITVIGTGDFTHPGWFSCLKEELVEAEPGLFRLRDEGKIVSPLPGVEPRGEVRFLLSAEISSIYKRHGATRKVHNLVYAPDFESAHRINARLAGIGNIESDGRPILGLDSRDLLEIVLEEAPEGFLVPAHIWTPWFSIFGSRSGFDAVEECFGDLSEHVFALETGLSSDPEMIRTISALDRFALISNSDCHSPGKLGREANLFSTGLDFFSIREALKSNRRDTFRGTVEFFPEEGKYHADGHRNCGVCLDRHETRRLGLLCPVCGKPLTIGVQHRVLELADREAPVYAADAPEFFSLIPLPEVLGELLRVGPSSKEVLRQYSAAIGRFGSEFDLLLKAPVTEIREASPLLGEAVERMRSGRVIRRPGFDGEFGVITLFEEGEIDRLAGQGSLFGDEPRRVRAKKEKAPLQPTIPAAATAAAPAAAGPNPEQEAAILHRGGHLIVSAGPGTGKTFTLTERIASLISGGADPERLCAITFTVKAAEEMAERLRRKAGATAENVFVGTFHRFALDHLRRESPGLAVAGPESRERLLKRLFPKLAAGERSALLEEISAALHDGGDFAPSEPVRRYLEELARMNAVDLDGVIPTLVRLLREDDRFLERVCGGIDHLLVDEFQDLNGSQYELVRLLAETATVFAIGDPDQAIYGFRGADPRFFRLFAESGAESVQLVRNYRCGSRIVEAAVSVISSNHRHPGSVPEADSAHVRGERASTGSARTESDSFALSQSKGVVLKAETPLRGEIELHTAATPAAEAELIVRRIEELAAGIEHLSIHSGRGGDGGRGRSFGDFAVLCRIGKQLDEVAGALERRGIPYQRVGATPYYLTPALRPAYLFLQCAAGSDQVAEWLRLLGRLPGVASTVVEALEAELPLTGDFPTLALSLDLSPQLREQISSFRDELEWFRKDAEEAGLREALAAVLHYLGIDPDQPDPRRLLNLAGSFGADLSRFAGHLRSYADATVYDPRAEGVALMTLHAAKGLEFPVVFLAGLEEGLLPCTMMGECDVEEERRLFYVGLTRAKERLVLSSAVQRPWAGAGERVVSRFAAEIPERLVTRVIEKAKAVKRKDGGQLALF